MHLAQAPPLTRDPCATDALVSAQLAAWLDGDGDKTIGALADAFGKRAFAIVFVVLLAVPALPLPTGGATHVFEAIAMLLALQLVAGRDELWLPRGWSQKPLATDGRAATALMRWIVRLERLSRPRLRFVFGHRVSNVVFGVCVVAGSAIAFVAPPFTGLDTLPALGIVLLSLGVLLEDVALALIGLIVLALGALLVMFAGGAVLTAVTGLL